MLSKFRPKTETKPYYPTVIDIETDGDGNDIGFGIAYQDENDVVVYKEFETIMDWFKWYIEIVADYERTNKEVAKRLRRIYAHNGAAFDNLKIHEVTADELIDEAQYFMASSIGIGYKVKYRYMKHHVMFVDSYRLMPASLKDLCATFQLPEQDAKLNLNGMLPVDVKYIYPELFWKYLKNDCISLQQILYKFWSKLYEKHGDIGQLPMTLPALAIRLFSMYLQEDLHTPTTAYQKDIERKAYHGGLVQCLETGEFQDVNIYDVNSMYPYVMGKYDYPTSYAGYITDKFNPKSIGLWHVKFKQDRHDLPPFIFDIENHLCYEGEAVITTNEANHLLDIGGSFDVIKGRIWSKTGPLFRVFINQFYADRKQAIADGDLAMAFILKILMNSLYGKFAEKEHGHKLVMVVGKIRTKILKNGGHYYALGDFIALVEVRRVPHSFVGIAALITANARIELHSLMVQLINNGKRVLYCDTDSIHFSTKEDIFELDVGPNLGQVKLEYSGTAVYAGKKLYATDKNVKAKGVGRAIKSGKLDYETMRQIAINEDASEKLSFSTFPTVKEVLSKSKRAAVMFERTRTIRNTGVTYGYTPKV